MKYGGFCIILYLCPGKQSNDLEGQSAPQNHACLKVANQGTERGKENLQQKGSYLLKATATM